MTSWAARVVRVLEQKDGHDRPGGESLLLLDRKFHLLSRMSFGRKKHTASSI